MITTINISLPKAMYEDARKALVRRGYSSISELVRSALRDVLYPKVTVNGFTPEFEERVLRSEKEPRSKDRVFKTEKDIDNFFLHFKEPGMKKPGR